MPPERLHKDSTQLLQNRLTVFSFLLPLSYLSSHSFLLLMTGNVYYNPGPIFTCSVCAENVTWRGTLVQCCNCSKWIHFKCSLFFLDSKLYAAPTPGAAFPASSEDLTPANTESFFSNSSNFKYLHYTTWPIRPHSANAALLAHPHPNLLSCFCPFCIFSLCTLLTASCFWLFSYTSCFLFSSPPPDMLRVLS